MIVLSYIVSFVRLIIVVWLCPFCLKFVGSDGGLLLFDSFFVLLIFLSDYSEQFFADVLLMGLFEVLRFFC